ncbi:MAG: SBBP repeat-containing protein [Planctomycetales bacterium]|nr:SBBP repeat-containing protein [Planctomycetales bacterium]
MMRLSFSVALCLAIAGNVSGGSIPAVSWIRQFGTVETDHAFDIAADVLGDIYVVGGTGGSMDGLPPSRGSAFIRKFTSEGEDIWVRQLRPAGTETGVSAYGVAVDSLDNVWLVGETNGDLFSGATITGRNGFISKYDSSGNLQLLNQIGFGNSIDTMWAVTTDLLGNAFIAGRMGGSSNTGRPVGRGVVFQYDSTGATWSSTINSNDTDSASSVAVDPSNAIYVGGVTRGRVGTVNYGSYDGFIRKYDANRDVRWNVQLGSSGVDGVSDLSVDPFGNLLVLALTNGSLGGTLIGNRDIVLRKYDPDGQLLWNKKIGTRMFDDPIDLSIDELGNIYIAGLTDGSLGDTNAGYRDVFIQRYSESGDLVWTKQLGTPFYDRLAGIEVTSPGVIYVAGYSPGSLSGLPVEGVFDCYLIKLVEVPEPSSLAILAALASVACWLPKKRGCAPGLSRSSA